MSVQSAKVIKFNPQNQSEKVELIASELTSVNGEFYTLNVNGVELVAKQAFSCLVKPIENDKVLIGGDEETGFYILSILERECVDEMQIELAKNTQILNKSGSIDLTAAKSINLKSNEFYSKHHNASFDHNNTTISSESVTAKGENLLASYEKITFMSKIMSSIVKNVFQKFQNYSRQTEQSDQIKAAQMTRDVKGLYTMGSKYTIMTSKKDTKIDGEHIHMG